MTNMKLKSILLLILSAFMLVLVACGGDSQPSPDIEAEPAGNPTTYPTDTPVPPIPTLSSVIQDTGVAVEADQRESGTEEQDEAFWNEPDSALLLPECTTDFRFSHQIADPEDLTPISFGLGSHVAPHEHMAYWGGARW